jgi:hypothetical protein
MNTGSPEWNSLPGAEVDVDAVECGRHGHIPRRSPRDHPVFAELLGEIVDVGAPLVRVGVHAGHRVLHERFLDPSQ